MLEFLKNIFASDFLPLGAWHLWQPGVLWLNVISDLAISLAYYAIPVLLFWFLRKRKDLKFSWILLAFGAFMLACGTTHLLGVWTVGHAATYRLDGVMKAITAVASVITIVLMVPLLPALVLLPNPKQLAAMNRELAAQAAELLRSAILIDLAQDAIMVRDLNGTIRFWNRGAEALYGWSRKEAVGRAIHELLQTRFPDTLEAIVEKVSRTGHWTGELLHTRRDGTTVTVLSRWTARLGKGGRAELLELNTDIAELLELNTDITERKDLENALVQKNTELEQANRRFQASIESGPDGILITSAAGEIILINSQAESMFGYRREELLHQSIEVLLPERFRAAHTGQRVGYVASPRIRPMGSGMELYGRRRDGTEFPVEISLSPVNSEDGLLVISSVRDATQRKQLELSLQEKNVELSKAIRAKDVFLATLSHELRTPLNAIIGYTGTLLMRLPGPLTTEQERQLKSIQTGGRHLLLLINDLLDLAKIESGKVHIQLEQTECREIVAEVASALSPLAQAKELIFESTCAMSSFIVKTDRRALSQILVNLVGNAIKFTPHGSVRLELTERQVNGRRMAALDVRDTGIGIKPEDLPRLFQAFERLHSALRVEGTGLGLHLCHRLAGLIDARIEVESEYGKGSRFTVLIPKA
jgi:PAS domain S-box-containing protein